MKLEIDLTWEPQNIGWNMTNKSEKYLPNSPDPRMVTSSNITVKVKYGVKMMKCNTLFIYKRLDVKR